MPYLGNTGTALYPSQLQTSSLTTDTGDGLISISDIVNGTSTTDSGIRLSSGGVESALFTEVDGTILSYGINIEQIGSTAGTPAYDTARSGGIFRLDTRTAAEAGTNEYDKHCFVVIGRGEGETTEYTALGINLNTGNTSLAPVNGGVGIGFDTAPETLLDIRGEGANTAQVSIRQWNNGTDGPDVRFHTSRGTVATPLGVQSGDYVGRFNSFIYNGTAEVQSGSFGWTSTGTAGETDFVISTRIAITGGTSYADRLKINSDGDIEFLDDQKILIGNDGDLELYHDSQFGGSYINKTSSGTFFIRGVSGNHIKIQALPDEDSIVAAANGKVELFYDNSGKLETSNNGVTVTGGVKASSFYSDQAADGSGNFTGQLILSTGTDSNDCAIKLFQEDNSSFPGQAHYIADKTNGDASAGQHRWYVFDDSSGSNSWSQLAVLDKSGNFGINTTTPSAKLEVYGGTAKLVRQHIGGGQSTNNAPNTYWKVGTWHGCSQGSRAKIVINGVSEYGNNTNAFGETIINLVFENSNNIEGTFYTIGGNAGPMDVAVKVDLTPSPDICEIWVKYSNGWSSNAINVDLTDGYFVGDNTNTNSGSLPTGATSLQSFFALRTIRANGYNYEELRVDQTGVTIQRHIKTNLDYPTVSPSLRLIFTKSDVLDSRINFIRDTTATYIDANGILKYANSNEPRFEYDQTTKEIKGLLFEREKTNLVTDINGGNYGYSMSGAPDSEPSLYDTAPDGSYVQCKYDVSSLTGSIFVNCNIDTPLTAGTTYTLSAWLRGDSISGDVSFAFVGETNYEIFSHTLNSSHAQGAVTSEWKRFELQFTPTGSQTSSRFQVYFGTQANGDIISVWGAQLEEGKFASSYIPRTRSAQSTRDSDRMYIGGQNFTNFYNEDEGTIVISSTPKIVDSSINTRALLIYEKKLNSITTSGGKGGFNIDYNGSAGLRHEVFGGSPVTGQASHTLSGTTAGTKYKAALAYKTNDLIYTVNGTEVGTDSTVVLPTDMGEMSVGGRVDVNYNTSNMSDMTVDSIIYYPKKLSNTELINITSY